MESCSPRQTCDVTACPQTRESLPMTPSLHGLRPSYGPKRQEGASYRPHRWSNLDAALRVCATRPRTAEALAAPPACRMAPSLLYRYKRCRDSSSYDRVDDNAREHPHHPEHGVSTCLPSGRCYRPAIAVGGYEEEGQFVRSLVQLDYQIALDTEETGDQGPPLHAGRLDLSLRRLHAWSLPPTLLRRLRRSVGCWVAGGSPHYVRPLPWFQKLLHRQGAESGKNLKGLHRFSRTMSRLSGAERAPSRLEPQRRAQRQGETA